MHRISALLMVLLIGCPTAYGGEIGTVFKRVKNAVVIVKVKEYAEQADDEGLVRPVSRGSLGSGVLVSEDGKVLTAAHVVHSADVIQVEFLSGEVVDAEVLTSEPIVDLAVLKLAKVPEGAAIASMGDSDKVDVGDKIFVVGAPYGVGHSLTVGHVSARREPTGETRNLGLGEFFQVDAAVNQGNSGGPLFNMGGEVIGVVSHIQSQSGGFEGLGFALTMKTVRERGLNAGAFWSGVQGSMIAGPLAAALNLPKPAGMLVERVASGSPASAMGIQGGTVPITYKGNRMLIGGDIIIQVQGHSTWGEGSYKRIRDTLTALKPGQRLTLKVWRRGREKELSTYIRRCSVC